MKDKLIIVGVAIAVVIVILVCWVLFTQDQVAPEDVPLTATNTNTQEVDGTKEVKLTQDQYKAILNAIFAADSEGKILIKADVIMEKVLNIDARLKILESKQAEVE